MVPKSLRLWFIAHFLLDYLFGIPLFIAPLNFLNWLGVEALKPADALLARLVAAALLGIGAASLLTRNKSVDSYQSLLTLKIV